MVEEKDRFGELVVEALRDRAASRQLPHDFTRRILQGGGVSGARLPWRWLKGAAAIVAMASFASLAAWIGETVYEAANGLSGEGPKTAEAGGISNQGGDTMIARRMATVVGASVLSVAVGAMELTSEPTFVFLRPETSSFWHTATNGVMTVPIDYPAGAKKATLDVTGVGYSRSYVNLTGESFSFSLPAADSPQSENVYDLKLTFDDGTERRAKLGLIQGLSPDAEGTTRCLAPANGKVWADINKKAVLPIPYGMTSFKVNGEETDTGLDGSQGWYAIGKIRNGETVSLSMVADGVEHMASLLGSGMGMMLIFK